jgi:hypothetical protein
VISIGFVDIGVAELQERLAEVARQEHVRHLRIDTVVESTTLRCMYELHTSTTSRPLRAKSRSPSRTACSLRFAHCVERAELGQSCLR